MSSSEVSLWITVTQRAGAILFAADIANTVFVDHRNLIDSDDISSDSVPQLLNASEVRGKPRSFVRSQSEGSDHKCEAQLNPLPPRTSQVSRVNPLRAALADDPSTESFLN